MSWSQQISGPKPLLVHSTSVPQAGQPDLRLLRRIGRIDPMSLDDYRAAGGFLALRRAIEMGPDRVVREVIDSKLVGRGGAAFPTGQKWLGARSAPLPRYLVCNADESEPGTFKDRVIMEHDPFSLIEAMTNAGPVFASSVGGVVDLLGNVVKEGQFNVCERGISVRPYDVDAFATGLGELIENPILRDKLGRAGFEFVEQNYRKERLLKDIEDLYGELVNHSQGA